MKRSKSLNSVNLHVMRPWAICQTLWQMEWDIWWKFIYFRKKLTLTRTLPCKIIFICTTLKDDSENLNNLAVVEMW